MAVGVPGQNSVHAAPSVIKTVNVSAPLVTWIRTAQERTSTEFNKNESSAVTRSVTVCYNQTAAQFYGPNILCNHLIIRKVGDTPI